MSLPLGPSRRARHHTPSDTQRRRTVQVAAVAAALALVTACGGGTTTAEKAPSSKGWATTTPGAAGNLDTAHWNLILEPTTLDPQQANNYGVNEVLANMCESLQTLNPDFSISDGLASLKVEDGGKRLVYSIDAKARFWDGQPVTGADAAFSLNRAWHPSAQQAPDYNQYFAAVSGIRATGPREVTVDLTRPDLLFRKMMATFAGAVVQARYSTAHPDYGKPSVPPMCSGPYTFKSWKTGSSLTLERNEHYWRGVTAKTRQVVFSFLQGDSSQTRALTGGGIEGMYQPPASALGRLGEHGKVYYGKSLLSFYLVPTAKSGPLRDPRIRQALFLALNRTAVARTAFGGAAVASRSMLPADVYGPVKATRSEGAGGSPEEIAQARKLVKEAGSPKGKIVLAGAPAISDSLTQTLQAVAEAARKIGLDAVYKPVTVGQFYELFSGPQGWRGTGADAFGSQWSLPVADPQALFSVWANPEDPSNYSQFADGAASKLIQQAGAEGDEGRRDGLLAEADKRLFDRMPWIPVVDVANVLYLNNSVTGPPASFVNWYYPWAQQLGATK
ncbi:glutathione ABC transporter substrate-binding protein [Streptomyces humidus]|uniref:Glutathione ABC transporter substrate-binding protein n=1 Tax=Streptomyces humidus TaxID=52259 RepID=A0A918G2F5_9ACTN|nr:ABC transporter substrate-binding protein [Streptomyces humidus]GGS16065.1 glutathione ABC transporter substrate-binding protein [Streptomyces humidus]